MDQAFQFTHRVSHKVNLQATHSRRDSIHATPEFDQYCTSNKIIMLCMPAHTSNLLQPLDVSCFYSLKHLYGQEVPKLVKESTISIRINSFPYTRKAQLAAFTDRNIKSDFQATGLIPYNPQCILSSHTVTKTPSPPGTANRKAPSLIDVKKISYSTQLEQQARLVRGLIQRQSRSSTNQAFSQLVKGYQIVMNIAVTFARENSEPREADQRRKQKQNYR